MVAAALLRLNHNPESIRFLAVFFFGGDDECVFFFASTVEFSFGCEEEEFVLSSEVSAKSFVIFYPCNVGDVSESAFVDELECVG